jgi:2-polyprenyl-6-methoxyphenol hydroxylase-like FAD-dependent oxidoreductase
MDTDVLIVGAGPTGLMLANQLGRRGVHALIVDRHAGPSLQTRALGVQARTLEIYAQLGIVERRLVQQRVQLASVDPRLAAAEPRIESREPHSIRFTPTEWQRFTDAAISRGVEVTRYIRECAIAGHGFISAQDAITSLRRETA